MILVLLLLFFIIYDKKHFYVYLLSMLFIGVNYYLSVGYTFFNAAPVVLVRFLPLVLGVAVLFFVMNKRSDEDV